MENQVNEQAVTTQGAAENPGRPLDIASGVALVAGVGVAFATNNVGFASLPLAAAVGIHLANRNKLMAALEQSQAATSAQIVQLVNQNQATIQDYLQKFQTETQQALGQQQQAIAAAQTALTQTLEDKATALQGELAQFKAEAEQTHGAMDERHQDLVTVVQELRQMENCSHTIEANPKADAYYQRGLSHKRLGDRQEAVRDFTEAIRLNGELADAYFHRGIVYAELGTRKLATDDLRKAYKLYFDQGDLESYERARGLHKEFYDGPGDGTEASLPPLVAESNGHGDSANPETAEADIKPLLEQEDSTTAANLFS